MKARPAYRGRWTARPRRRRPTPACPAVRGGRYAPWPPAASAAGPDGRRRSGCCPSSRPRRRRHRRCLPAPATERTATSRPRFPTRPRPSRCRPADRRPVPAKALHRAIGQRDADSPPMPTSPRRRRRRDVGLDLSVAATRMPPPPAIPALPVYVPGLVQRTRTAQLAGFGPPIRLAMSVFMPRRCSNHRAGRSPCPGRCWHPPCRRSCCRCCRSRAAACPGQSSSKLGADLIHHDRAPPMPTDNPPDAAMAADWTSWTDVAETVTRCRRHSPSPIRRCTPSGIAHDVDLGGGAHCGNARQGHRPRRRRAASPCRSASTETALPCSWRSS